MKPELKLLTEFTSTGEKFAYHTEQMTALERGEVPGPILTWLMLTDICNASCAFCSTLTREGDSLSFLDIDAYLDILCPLGVRATVLSGGGNPILWRDRESGANFDDIVSMIHDRGLEIGLITNGMPMKKFPCGRTSWKSVKPETLDKLKWVRISMAGLDHPEKEVYVPDIDQSKTTLGFSYVLHDIYHVSEEPNHGKVSTLSDLGSWTPTKVEKAEDRIDWLKEQFDFYIKKYNPTYLRCIPNCLEINKIESRCKQLDDIAKEVNPDICFVQYKPPSQPDNCYLGYLRPCLNSDGWVFACDSVVLNESAGHKFAAQWRVCRWDKIGDLYKQPLHSLVNTNHCKGCVFHSQNKLLNGVVNGLKLPIPEKQPLHVNFV